jgi:hypothetical protein
MPHDEIVQAIESDVIPQYQAHLEKTGFIPALKSGFHKFVGGTEEALGFKQAAEEQRQKIAEFEGMTDADVKAAKERGLFSGIGATLTKELTEPIGGIVGRYGIPTAASLITRTPIGFGAADIAPEIGESMEAQKAAGQEVDPMKAIAAGLAKTAIATIGMPGVGKLAGALGPKLLAEAEVLAPQIAKGTLTKEAALESLSGRAKTYAQSMLANTVAGTGMMVGTEDIERFQTGQPLLSPEEMLGSLKTAAILSPVFGALHPTGRGAAEAKIGEAATKRQTKLDAIEAKKQAREEAFFRIEQDALAEKLAQEEAAKKAQEDFDAANAPNKFGNYAPEKSKLAKSIADAVNLPEQESIKQATKARDTAFEDLPKNIVSLAKRPELPSVDNVTHIDDNFTKAIGTAPNAGFLKNIKGMELNAENAPKIQQEIENYNGTSKTVLNNLKQYSNRLEDIKNGNDARVNERRASENLSIFGQPEPGVTEGNEGVNRLRDNGAPVDVSAARARKESINAPIEAATKPTTPNLLTKLRDLGGINMSDLRDVTGETRKPEKRGYYNLFNQRAKSLMEHIENGSLDEYLPYTERLESTPRDEAFDAGPAYDRLSQVIKNNEALHHFGDEQRMAEARNELKMREEEPTDINQQLDEVANVEKGMGVKYAKAEVPEGLPLELAEKMVRLEKADRADNQWRTGNTQRSQTMLARSLLKSVRKLYPGKEEWKVLGDLNTKHGDWVKNQVDNIKEARGFGAFTKETVDTIKQALKERFGKNVEKAVNRGDLNIIESKDVPAGIDPDAVAYFDKGKVYLIADRLSKEDAGAKLLHEMGVHYGLEGMIGKEIYRDVLRTVNRLNKMDKVATAAHDYVNARYPELKPGSAEHTEEVLARIGETAPQHTLWRRVVSAVKNFLIKKGLYSPDKLSVRDLHDLINSSLHKALKGEKKPVVLEMREAPVYSKSVIEKLTL